MPVVTYELENGGAISVQVDDGATGVVTRGGRGGVDGVTARAGATFEAAMAQVRPVADAVLATLTALAHSPSEVSVDFAIGMTAEGGALIASAGASANFSVHLVWRPGS